MLDLVNPYFQSSEKSAIRIPRFVSGYGFSHIVVRSHHSGFSRCDPGLQFYVPHFQLQFGCVLLPVKVNCFCWLPSASMDQICSPPERLD